MDEPAREDVPVDKESRFRHELRGPMSHAQGPDPWTRHGRAWLIRTGVRGPRQPPVAGLYLVDCVYWTLSSIRAAEPRDMSAAIAVKMVRSCPGLGLL